MTNVSLIDHGEASGPAQSQPQTTRRERAGPSLTFVSSDGSEMVLAGEDLLATLALVQTALLLYMVFAEATR